MVGTRGTSGVMRQGKGTSASTACTQMVSAWETKQEGLELHVQLQHYQQYCNGRCGGTACTTRVSNGWIQALWEGQEVKTKAGTVHNVKDQFGCVRLLYRIDNSQAESLCLRARGQATKRDSVARVCYGPLIRVAKWKKISLNDCVTNTCSHGGFILPGLCSEGKITGHKQSRFLVGTGHTL